MTDAPKAPKAPAKKKATTAKKEPVVETPVADKTEQELPTIVKVKNAKAVEFEVSRAYYLANQHKLERV